ncbi:hypothetical protein RND81_03G227400 [Saponaria officinalis]|uniref:Aminotransferase-like plant mobile domain-containing protein n=1 Tax=Saponaria officinalis TaxID=3572 RepID=A0AAW1M6T9_SAPOF
MLENNSSIDELIEIPFEPNLDLWDLLEGYQCDSTDVSDVNFDEVDNALLQMAPEIDKLSNNTNSNVNNNILRVMMAGGDDDGGPFYGRGGERQAPVNASDRRRRVLRFSDTVSEPGPEGRQPPRVQTESDPGVLSPAAAGAAAGVEAGASPVSVGAGRDTECGTSSRSRPHFRFVCSGSNTRRDSVEEGDDVGVSGRQRGDDGDGEDDILHGDVSASSFVRVKRLRTGRFAAIEEGSGSGTGSRAGGSRGGGRRQRGTDRTWLLTGGSPGGPEDPSVIPSFGGHIAYGLWLDPMLDRPVLVGYQRHNKLRELMGWRSIDDDMRTFLDDSGLRHLGGCMLAHIDMPLISAFVERWQPDTNTFHLPFGEMSILLHDVEKILRLPIHGRECGPSSSGEAGLDPTFYIAHLLGKQQEDLNRATAYLAVLLGSTVFVDKSGDRLRAAIFPLLGDMRTIPKFRQDIESLRSYRRRIDALTPGMVEWLPFGFQDEHTSRSTFSGLLRFMQVIEPYQPDRCLRQFGYLQVIPRPMQAPSYAYRPSTVLHYTVEYVGYSDHQWDTWIDHRVGRALAEAITPMDSARTTEKTIRYWNRNRCGIMELARQLLSCGRGRGRGRGRGGADVAETSRTSSAERTATETASGSESESV